MREHVQGQRQGHEDALTATRLRVRWRDAARGQVIRPESQTTHVCADCGASIKNNDFNGPKPSWHEAPNTCWHGNVVALGSLSKDQRDVYESLSRVATRAREECRSAIAVLGLRARAEGVVVRRALPENVLPLCAAK